MQVYNNIGAPRCELFQYHKLSCLILQDGYSLSDVKNIFYIEYAFISAFISYLSMCLLMIIFLYQIVFVNHNIKSIETRFE